MADHPTREEFDRLRAELVALRRQVARPRRRALLPALCLALLVALVPLAVLAVTPFTDLTGGVHDQNIDAIYQVGVTRGCVPDQEYCPTDNVTREEMASFLARLGGLGSNPPVANALTAQSATTADTATSATSATSAGNANTVGGYAPAGLVRAARGAGPTVFNPVTLTGAFLAVAEVTLQAPGAGVVLVSGAVIVDVTVAAGCPCRADFRLRDAGTGATSPQILTNMGNTGGASFQQSLTPVWAFPVAGAGPQTFQLQVFQASGTGTLRAANGAMTALYVPFGPTGGSTLDLP